MTWFYGPHHAFETTSPTVPGVVRHYQSFDAFADEGFLARIYGGMHFRSSLEEGAREGKKVGNWVIDHFPAAAGLSRWPAAGRARPQACRASSRYDGGIGTPPRRSKNAVMRTAVVLLGAFLTALPAAAQISATEVTAPALGPRTIVPATVSCTDTPTGVIPQVALHVVAPHTADRKQSSVNGELVILSGGTPEGLAIGQQYFARRLKRPVNHEAITPANPGAIQTTGWLTVVAADTKFAIARVDYACVPVDPGDYLQPYAEPALPSAVAPKGPTDFSELGRVLFGANRRESFGAGDLISIDRGQTRGMTTGTRVAFYRDRRNGTPLIEIGEGIVIEVSAESSKVVVERATLDVIRGDYYGISGRR